MAYFHRRKMSKVFLAMKTSYLAQNFRWGQDACFLRLRKLKDVKKQVNAESITDEVSCFSDLLFMTQKCHQTYFVAYLASEISRSSYVIFV